MKKQYAGRMAFAVSVLLLCSAFSQTIRSWTVKQGTQAGFTIDGFLGVDVNGKLAFSGSQITFDPARPEAAKMEVELDVNSLNTGIRKRDRDLLGEAFFYAEKYPSIRFVSEAVKRTESGYSVTGNLRIRETTRRVTIPFTYAGAEGSGVFKGAFTIDRMDYKVGENKKTGIGREVRISLEVPVVPQ